MKKTMTKSDVWSMLFFAMAGLLFGAVLIGWLSGCGEHYVDINGVSHNYECFK
jgi:hypothetical protein